MADQPAGDRDADTPDDAPAGAESADAAPAEAAAEAATAESPKVESAPAKAAEAGDAAAPSGDPNGDDPDAHALDPADQAAIDELLRQASFEDVDAGGPAAPGGGAPAERAGPPVQSLDLPSFQRGVDAMAAGGGAGSAGIDLLRDVDLNVTIELGRSRMRIEDVLRLGEGSVVELDKLAGDPVDVFVNDRLVARGEVLVLNDNFCVRVNEVVSAAREEEP